jgi:hypothetical protein
MFPHIDAGQGHTATIMDGAPAFRLLILVNEAPRLTARMP